MGTSEMPDRSPLLTGTPTPTLGPGDGGEAIWRALEADGGITDTYLFLGLVAEELERAREKHPRPQASLHEGYAVLLEEVDEFWEAVKAHRADQDPHHVLVELLQVAAMACRAAVDRGLLAAVDMPSAGGAGDILTSLVASHDAAVREAVGEAFRT